MEFLAWLEQTGLATFVRESPSFFGFPTFLFMHTLGLSLVVGPAVIIGSRVLGIASTIPLRPLVRLFPYMWAGFVITILSGAGLAVADATNKLVNPILLVKLALILVATVNLWWLEKKVFRGPELPEDAIPGGGQVLAASLLSLWLAVTVAGRLIAYSRTIFG